MCETKAKLYVGKCITLERVDHFVNIFFNVRLTFLAKEKFWKVKGLEKGKYEHYI